MYWKRLYAICYSQTRDIEASEEMVQDIFISLWKRWDHLEITSSLENYLVKSAKLKVIDYFREECKSKLISSETNDEDTKKEPRSAVIAHNEVELEILKHHADHLVNQLPYQCQTVYRLSRENQLSTKEIALQLGLSQKTVKNHLTKALSFMRHRMISNPGQ